MLFFIGYVQKMGLNRKRTQRTLPKLLNYGYWLGEARRGVHTYPNVQM